MKENPDNKRMTIYDALPCPFCGSKPTLSFRVVGEGHDGGFVVGCETYGYGSGTFCRGNNVGFSVLYKTEEDAINAWNKRVP